MVFGFSQEPETLLKHKLSERLGLSPRIIDFGNAGRFFFYASYGDIVETEQIIAFKLGFARSLTKSPLSTQQLVDQKVVTPHHVDHQAFRGNALVACFSKKEAQFSVYKTLLSLPQLYFSVSGREWIGADNLHYLTTLLDQIDIDEEVIPSHFLFRLAPGPLTILKNVRRLCPGELLTWREGDYRLHRLEDLRFQDDPLSFTRANSDSRNRLYQELEGVIGAYTGDIQKSGQGLANLLSGGVDSSIIQLALNKKLPSTPIQSFSIVPCETPSFEFEVEYARHASTIFNTEHTFVDVTPQEYADLLPQTIEILGQPVFSDVEPGKLALARFLAERFPHLRFYFVGQGADALFGLKLARKLKIFESIGKIPGSRLALAAAGKVISSFSVKGRSLSKAALLLSASNNPHLFIAPPNTVAVYSDIEFARRCFGDETLRRVFEYRRNLEKQYLDSANLIEKVHTIDLLTDSYEVQVQSAQLFQAYQKEQVYPFLDDDIIRAGFAFSPQIRYLDGLRPKPLLKDILEERDLAVIARKPKGASVYTNHVFAWMKSGPLHEMVQAIDPPAFLSRVDFEKLKQKPDYFLWNLLTFDIFKKKVLKV